MTVNSFDFTSNYYIAFGSVFKAFKAFVKGQISSGSNDVHVPGMMDGMIV